MTEQTKAVSLLETYAAERNMTRDDLVVVMMKTIMPKDKNGNDIATLPDLLGFLQIARRFDLDPWAREIFMIMTKAGLRPYVSIDGYSKIANRQPDYDGCEFEYEKGEIELTISKWGEQRGERITNRVLRDGIVAVTCRIYRKGHSRPTMVTEFFDECYRESEPWNQSPARQLRHKAFMQCVRLAFGISGALGADDDDVQQTIDITPAETSELKAVIDAAKPKPPSAPVRDQKAIEDKPGVAIDRQADEPVKQDAKPARKDPAKPKVKAEKPLEGDIQPPAKDQKSTQKPAESVSKGPEGNHSLDIDEFVQSLAGAMRGAKSIEAIDEYWSENDVEAVLTVDEEALTLAQGLRAKAVRRLSEVAG